MFVVACCFPVREVSCYLVIVALSFVNFVVYVSQPGMPMPNATGCTCSDGVILLPILVRFVVLLYFYLK